MYLCFKYAYRLSPDSKWFDTKCSLEAYLSVNKRGRSGNNMGEYASVMAHAKRLGLIPFIPQSMKTSLDLFFR